MQTLGRIDVRLSVWLSHCMCCTHTHTEQYFSPMELLGNTMYNKNAILVEMNTIGTTMVEAPL